MRSKSRVVWAAEKVFGKEFSMPAAFLFETRCISADFMSRLVGLENRCIVESL